jgi:aspartate/methionine/tyrosine aminotransferase
MSIWQYDCLTFDEPHVRIGSLSEGLWKRTVTVGSAGKSFAATGWRIGWCIGPAEILRPITAAMTRITFCSVSPLQEALATGFQAAKKENFFETQCAQYQARRDLLLRYLDQLGLPYTVSVSCLFLIPKLTSYQRGGFFFSGSLQQTRRGKSISNFRSIASLKHIQQLNMGGLQIVLLRSSRDIQGEDPGLV